MVTLRSLSPPCWCILLALFGGMPASAQLISIFGNKVEIAAGDSTPSLTDHTDFGGVDLGPGGFIDRQFTIKNVGASPLRLLGFNKLGSHAGEFTVPIPPALIIPGSGETTMTVRFIPNFLGGGGVRRATLRFFSNASDDPTFDFAIAGEALTPSAEINVQGNGLDIADGDPVARIEDHTDFGSIDIAADGVTHTFTIQNTGDLNLRIFSVEILGGNNDQFFLTSAPSNTVFPAGETSFNLEFNPDRTGIHLVTVRIGYFDPSEGFYDFVIRGTATTSAPQLTLLGNETAIPDGDVTPSSDDHTKFPSTNLETSTTHTFSISNSGTAPLSVASIELLGSAADDFSSSSPPENTIAPGSEAPLHVTFKPSAPGARPATLRLTSNDPDNPLFEVALLGTGGGFKLVQIERVGEDALIHFTSNPDTDVTTYIYSIRHSTDLATWTTVGSFLSPGARNERFHHIGGLKDGHGFWQIAETTIR